MSRLALAILLLSGCTFSPSDLPSLPSDGGSVDSPMMGDGGALDGQLPDGGLPRDGAPDAEVDTCPGGSTQLVLGTSRQGTIGGSSLYEPTCAATNTGGEDLYRVDVGAASGMELVFDVDEMAKIDTVLDVTTMCVANPQVGTCADIGVAGNGEVVVIPSPSPGRLFVAVDSLGGTGAYTIAALLRSVVGDGFGCTPDLRTSRCATGLHCLEQGGSNVCRNVPATTDTGANESLCTTSTSFNGDGVFRGFMQVGDVDVVAVNLSTARRLRLVVHDGAGGCAADLFLQVFTGATCDTATVAAFDDNTGLGPCPRIDSVDLPAGRSWVRVTHATNAKLGGGAPYELELDVF